MWCVPRLETCTFHWGFDDLPARPIMWRRLSCALLRSLRHPLHYEKIGFLALQSENNGRSVFVVAPTRALDADSLFVLAQSRLFTSPLTRHFRRRHRAAGSLLRMWRATATACSIVLLPLAEPSPIDPGKPSEIISSTHMVVVARHDEDVTWVPTVAASWPDGGAGFVIIDHGGSTHNSVPANKGKEASAYLSYVTQRYDSLPEWIFFVHANLTSWHHDGTLGERLVAAWKLAQATGRRYIEINNFRQAGGLDRARGPLLSADEPNISRRVRPDALDEWRREYLEPHVDFGAADWVRGSVCCAQFLVHKDQITRHPKMMYDHLYAWSTDEARDDYVEGRYLEYAWHVIWGDEEARNLDPSILRCGEQPTEPWHVFRPCTRYEKAQREEEEDLQDEL